MRLPLIAAGLAALTAFAAPDAGHAQFSTQNQIQAQPSPTQDAGACPQDIKVVHEYGNSIIPRKWVTPLPAEAGSCPGGIKLSNSFTFQVVINKVSGGRMQFQTSPDPDGVDADTPRLIDKEIIRQTLLVRNRNVSKVIPVEGRGWIYDITGRLFTPPGDEAYIIAPSLPEGAPDINRAMFCHGEAQGPMYCRFAWQVTPDYKVLASDSFIGTGDPKQLFDRFETAQEGIRRILNLAGEDVRRFRPPEENAQQRDKRPQMVSRSPTGRIIVQKAPPANPRAAMPLLGSGQGFVGEDRQGPALEPAAQKPEQSQQSKLQEAIELRNMLRNQLELIRRQRPLVADDEEALATLAAQEVQLRSRLRNQQSRLRELIAEAEENSRSDQPDQEQEQAAPTPTPRPTPIIRGRRTPKDPDNPFDVD
ncbi:MAG: hypothetical protein Alpg2KO_25100 [Alphaproteobacteria bacterium]